MIAETSCTLVLFYSANKATRYRTALALSRGTSLALTIIESLREFFRWWSSLYRKVRAHTCALPGYIQITYPREAVVGMAITYYRNNVGERVVQSDFKKIGRQRVVSTNAYVYVTARARVSCGRKRPRLATHHRTHSVIESITSSILAREKYARWCKKLY